MHDFEQGILTAEYASSIRDKISDEHTLNVSAYDPNGFADPPSYVIPFPFLFLFQIRTLSNFPLQTVAMVPLRFPRLPLVACPSPLPQP